MKRAVWMVVCLVGTFSAGAAPIGERANLVDLIVLFDTTQIQEWEDRRRAAEFGRGLIDNLPPRVGVQAFRFGDSPDLAPIPLDQVTIEGLESDAAAFPGLTLQHAILEAEKRLCSQTGEENLPGKALVLIGASRGNESLTLSGSCQITVYSISTSSEIDPPLDELAERTHGRYYSLAGARGFIVARNVKGRVWAPAVTREMRRVEVRLAPTRWREVIAIVSILLLVAWYRASGRKRRLEPASSELLPLSFAEPIREASLKICSVRGEGSVFPVSSRESVILGGNEHASSSTAQLLLPDPLVASEHCKIYMEKGAYFITDMGSELGTFVNQVKISAPTPLVTGDLVQIGETVLAFRR